jgi:hypothetical protein
MDLVPERAACFSLHFLKSATHLHPGLMLPAILLTISAGITHAQCPPVGADTTCATIITVTNTGGTVTYTGQGPYDLIDDTLVGVVNNSTLPISSMVLTSGAGGPDIFGFDGDGICGNSPNTGLPYVPAPPGCPFGPTTYEGPGVSFSNISSDHTTGTVTFTPPIPVGGTAYFSLEDQLDLVTTCSSIINNSVTNSSGTGTQTGITATFTPNLGYTLAQAATLCGFTGWNWQQTVTSLPAPSPFLAAGSAVPLVAPPPFNDPPPQGYAYQNPPNAVQLPVYWNPFTTGSLSLAAHETSTTLSFSDAPADPCLPGGNPAACGGTLAPAGSQLGFTTHLVGIVGSLPGAGVLDTGIGFSWTDNFNGTSGGIAVINNPGGVDTGSGTGGATITQISTATTYQYPISVSVIAVNGAPVSSPPPPTLLGAGQIKTTSSGLAYSRVTQTFDGTVELTNVGSSAIAGPIQVVMNSLTSGVTLVNATGTFGGFPFVTVPGVNSLTPGQSVTVSVQFKNPAGAAIHFAALPYSGSFN